MIILTIRVYFMRQNQLPKLFISIHMDRWFTQTQNMYVLVTAGSFPAVQQKRGGDNQPPTHQHLVPRLKKE